MNYSSVVDYSTLPLSELHNVVRNNLSLLKNETIKNRLPELATYIPEYKQGPLIYRASILAAIYCDDVHIDYLRILLENGANPNETSYKCRELHHETPLDGFFEAVEWLGELNEEHQPKFMLLIQYGLKVERITEKWYYSGEIILETIRFCKEYEKIWKCEQEELCCKQVDE